MNRQLAFLLMTTMIGAASTVKADDSGLASIHDWRNESGRRVCMSDHFHDGSGTGKTRKEAEAAAKSSWISFTVFEYGTDWGSYAAASSATMNCSNSSPQNWSCSTSARPCKKHDAAKMVRRAKNSHSASR